MKTKNLWESFHHAFDGLMHCIRHERNIRIHLTMGCLALILAVALNTAIENVIDLVSPEFHPLAKIVKDITAGAVLFSCIAAVIIGCLIFIPYLWALL